MSTQAVFQNLISTPIFVPNSQIHQFAPISQPLHVNFNLDLPKSKEYSLKKGVGTNLGRKQLQDFLQQLFLNLFQTHSKSDIWNWVFGRLGEKGIMVDIHLIDIDQIKIGKNCSLLSF